MVKKAKCKKNRQRESNAAHRAKTKVERWAANDGHKYPKRVYEQCGKEFYPNSTRQRFCNTDCTKIHQQAEALFSRLVKQLSEKEGVTEALKAENQTLWVQRMNNIRSAAMEIVSSELIDGVFSFSGTIQEVIKFRE